MLIKIIQWVKKLENVKQGSGFLVNRKLFLVKIKKKVVYILDEILN